MTDNDRQWQWHTMTMTDNVVDLFVIFCKVAWNGKCRYHVGRNHCPLQQNESKMTKSLQQNHDYAGMVVPGDNDDDYAGKNDDDGDDNADADDDDADNADGDDADGDDACHPARFAGKRRGERRTAKACAK